MRFRQRLIRLIPVAGLLAATCAGGSVHGADMSFRPPLPSMSVLTPFQPPPTRYGSGHRGVDLAAATDTQVRAIADGVVIHAASLAGRGVVSVEHAGQLRSTYEPVTASVRQGEPVTRGQVIGVLEPGHASCAPASCLHLGARLPDRVYLDPMSLFGPWRVRLKPWDAPLGAG